MSAGPESPLGTLVNAPRTAARRPFGCDPVPDDLDDRVFDVCVIGSGAAGAITAAACAAAGLDVAVLERGPHPGAASFDELVELSEPAYARDAKGCWSLTGYPWTTCNVGGGTVFYGAAAFRYRRVDFAAGGHFGDGDLPVDWPYDYAALAPYYAEVESLVGVSGDAAADPTHPDPSSALPMPPVETSPGGARLLKAAAELALHAFPTPLAIASQGYRGRSGCVADTPCMETACPHGAKGVAEPPCVPTPGAVGNAIARITGARVHQLPMTPARVWEAMQA